MNEEVVILRFLNGEVVVGHSPVRSATGVRLTQPMHVLLKRVDEHNLHIDVACQYPADGMAAADKRYTALFPYSGIVMELDTEFANEAIVEVYRRAICPIQIATQLPPVGAVRN